MEDFHHSPTPPKQRNHWGRGGRKTVRARGKEHQQQSSICPAWHGHCAHGITAVGITYPIILATIKPAWMGEGFMKSPHWEATGNWWLLREEEPVFLIYVVLRGCPYSSRQSYIHEQSHHTEWSDLVVFKNEFMKLGWKSDDGRLGHHWRGGNGGQVW